MSVALEDELAEPAPRAGRTVARHAVAMPANVLDVPEIAELLGVSESSVSTWLRSSPAAVAVDVEMVDGRTGEPVTGRRAEIAELHFTPDGA